MISYLDPSVLLFQRLIFRRTGKGDYRISLGDRFVGEVKLVRIATMEGAWIWSLVGPCLPDKLQPSHGESDTLTSARAELLAKLLTWLNWAKAEGYPALWDEP